MFLLRKLILYRVVIFDVSGSFTTDSMVICLYEQNLYCIDPGKVQVRTFQVTIYIGGLKYCFFFHPFRDKLSN